MNNSKHKFFAWLLPLALSFLAFTGCKETGEAKTAPAPNPATADNTAQASIKSVKIGNQTWMSQNLNDPSKGGKCYEDKPENCEKYGRLYTWEEAIKACPSGWRLPNNDEWKALVAFAGGESSAGGKLKAKSGWENGGDGTDEYGFSALPSGLGTPGGDFGHFGYDGFWWSSTDNGDDASRWSMFYGDSDMTYKEEDYKETFYSVRCIKEAK